MLAVCVFVIGFLAHCEGQSTGRREGLIAAASGKARAVFTHMPDGSEVWTIVEGDDAAPTKPAPPAKEARP